MSPTYPSAIAMIDKTILYKSASIRYRLYGKGMPVVLLHGFGEDGSIWKNQIEFLSSQFTLIVPDLPGSGKSSPLENKEANIEEYAESIRAIVTKENISSLVIIGHSMGGYVALAYGEKYSESIIGLGLFHSTAFADNELKIEARKKAIAFIVENGSSAFLKTTTPGLFYDKEKNQSTIDALLSNANQFEKETLVEYYQSMMNRPDRTAVLTNATYPVLFIAGQHDIAVPLSDSLKQAALSDVTFFHLFENSGHMGMIEEKDKANHILLDFLNVFIGFWK